MIRKALYILLIMLCCGLSSRTAAQSLTDDSLTVSLLTCAPGSQIYELEGHSGLRLRGPAFDVVANWGLFDFNSPGFVYRFVKGETDYCVGAIPTEFFLMQYKAEGRRVTEQTLNLTRSQTQTLDSLIRENLQPQNRVYRYNYVLDNCATRPLALVERATGYPIELSPALTGLQPHVTFRRVMQHYHTNYPWYQFGIDLALGCGIDRTITEREIAFAPEALEHMVAQASIITPDGKIPLVKSTRVLVDGPEEGTALEATPWLLTPLCAMTALLLCAIALSVRDLRRRRLTVWGDILLFGALGTLGIILTFLIFISIHEATSPNYLYLWINPLCLAVAVLVCFRSKACKRALVVIDTLITAGVLTYTVVAIAGLQSCNVAFVPLMATVVLRCATAIAITRRQLAK